jgi:DNA-nicking Smr family endonuclease
VRPEASLDLHGKTVDEADAALRRFLAESARLRRRCVLVIHGRGLHSDGVAVLRDSVIDALTGALSGYVHCLSAAAPADGGAGATYVMVRS